MRFLFCLRVMNGYWETAISSKKCCRENGKQGKKIENGKAKFISLEELRASRNS
jgi:hypothetical protein